MDYDRLQPETFDALLEMLRALESQAETRRQLVDVSSGLESKESTVARWMNAINDILEEPADYSECPYYRNPNGEVCSFGCWEEPRCYTSEPRDGWPGAQVAEAAAKVLEEQWASIKESDEPGTEAAQLLWGRRLLASRLPGQPQEDDEDGV